MIHIFYDLNETRKDLTKNYNPENEDEFYHLIENDTYFHRLICKQVIQCFSDYYEQASKKQNPVREIFIKDQINFIDYLLTHYKVKSEVVINGRSNTMISDLKSTRDYWINAKKNTLALANSKLNTDFEQEFADIIYDFKVFLDNHHTIYDLIRDIRGLHDRPPLVDKLNKSNFSDEIVYSKEISMNSYLATEVVSRACFYDKMAEKTSKVVNTYQKYFNDMNNLISFLNDLIWHYEKLESLERIECLKKGLKEAINLLKAEKLKLNGSNSIQFEDFFNQGFKQNSDEFLKHFRNNSITNKKIAFIIHILVDLNIIEIEREGLSRLKFTEFIKGVRIKNNYGVNRFFQSSAPNTLKDDTDKGYYRNDYDRIKKDLKGMFNIS